MRTDVWSAGVMLYELLAETVPFPGDLLEEQPARRCSLIVRTRMTKPEEQEADRVRAGTRRGLGVAAFAAALAACSPTAWTPAARVVPQNATYSAKWRLEVDQGSASLEPARGSHASIERLRAPVVGHEASWMPDSSVERCATVAPRDGTATPGHPVEVEPLPAVNHEWLRPGSYRIVLPILARGEPWLVVTPFEIEPGLSAADAQTVLRRFDDPATVSCLGDALIEVAAVEYSWLAPDPSGADRIRTHRSRPTPAATVTASVAPPSANGDEIGLPFESHTQGIQGNGSEECSRRKDELFRYLERSPSQLRVRAQASQVVRRRE